MPEEGVEFLLLLPPSLDTEPGVEEASSEVFLLPGLDRAPCVKLPVRHPDDELGVDPPLDDLEETKLA